MKTALWKNQISDNLKNALESEMKTLLNNEVKYIREQNKRLLEDNKHKLQLIKRLKRTLAKEQGLEIHEINILKEEVV
jgi:fibronectin type 3 domain-containing protein